jgi:hypothetical protein
MLPFKIYTRKKIFNYYTGLSFFVFIWLSRLDKDHVRLIRHETIHFWQQVELLFVFHWIFYGIFYVMARIQGHCHYVAYRFNPFEVEAFMNEGDESYLRKRKPFAWINYLPSFNMALFQELNSIVPKEKLVKW